MGREHRRCRRIEPGCVGPDLTHKLGIAVERGASDHDPDIRIERGAANSGDRSRRAIEPCRRAQRDAHYTDPFLGDDLDNLVFAPTACE